MTHAEALAALDWAHRLLIARDQMNAAVHCQEVRYSPVTLRLGEAMAFFGAQGVSDK